MEAQEQTKVEEVSLEDRFSEFQEKVKRLNQKPEALTKELEVKQAKLERLRTGHLSQLALGEIEKAKTQLPNKPVNIDAKYNALIDNSTDEVTPNKIAIISEIDGDFIFFTCI